MDKPIADQAIEAYLRLSDLTTSFMWPLKLSSSDLPTSQIAVLHELSIQGCMNLTQLAFQVSVAKQTMTDISTKLIKLGYVERIQDENNRRQILLQLTPDGQTYINDYEHARHVFLRDQVFGSLNAEQLTALREASETLCALQNQTLIGEKYGNRNLPK